MPSEPLSSFPEAPEPPAGQEQNDPGKKAPPLPKIGKREKAFRVAALPVSTAVGGFYFHKMSRDGLQDFFDERHELDDLRKQVDSKYNILKAHPDPAAIRNKIGDIYEEFDTGVKNILKENKFTNTFQYFKANPGRNKLNILLSTGAAISISLGLIVTLLDPRNRSAITGLFHKVNANTPSEAQPQR